MVLAVIGAAWVQPVFSATNTNANKNTNTNKNTNANRNTNTNTNTNSNLNTNKNKNIPPAGLIVPGAPNLLRLSPTALRLVVSANGNTFGTLFSNQETISGKYLRRDGTFGTTPAFLPFLDWGGDSGVIISTTPNTRYRFQTTAKNEL